VYAKPSASRSIWWSSQVLNSSQVCLVRVSPAFVTRSRRAIAKELARWLRLRPWLRHEHAAHIPCKIRVLTLRLTSLASPRISAPRQVPHSDQPIRLPSTLRRPAATPPPSCGAFFPCRQFGKSAARNRPDPAPHRRDRYDRVGVYHCRSKRTHRRRNQCPQRQDTGLPSLLWNRETVHLRFRTHLCRTSLRAISRHLETETDTSTSDPYFPRCTASSSPDVSPVGPSCGSRRHGRGSPALEGVALHVCIPDGRPGRRFRVNWGKVRLSHFRSRE